VAVGLGSKDGDDHVRRADVDDGFHFDDEKEEEEKEEVWQGPTFRRRQNHRHCERFAQMETAEEVQSGNAPSNP